MDVDTAISFNDSSQKIIPHTSKSISTRSQIKITYTIHYSLVKPVMTSNKEILLLDYN